MPPLHEVGLDKDDCKYYAAPSLNYALSGPEDRICKSVGNNWIII